MFDEGLLSIIGFFLGLLFGIGIGQSFTNRQWSKNADDYRRLHYNGRLYKVIHDDGDLGREE